TDMPYRYKHSKSPLRFIHLAQGLLLLLGIVAFTLWLTEREFSLSQERLRNDAMQEALTLKVRLETELNSNLFLANGLAATIVSYPDLPPAAINSALAELYSLGRNIRTIALAPENRVAHIHPLKGNESTIGTYYPDLPARWPGIEAAIDRRETTIAGPLGPAGDQTLVSRTPVYLQDGTYWGMLSVSQDFQGLLSSAALHMENPNYVLALRDLTSDSLAPFWG